MTTESQSPSTGIEGLTITIHVDTTELDKAIAKAEKLNQLLDKTENRDGNHVSGLKVQLDGEAIQKSLSAFRYR
ncbi:hypothetical protein [Faecalibaculum rodentium]|uniref:hypothetical protein n=1 Tax=Faecalibaculum rodentium TaxID=1702221 RepID=UPI00272EF90C|nr:hypothetical protein [Faecalibaculum rodentium]